MKWKWNKYGVRVHIDTVWKFKQERHTHTHTHSFPLFVCIIASSLKFCICFFLAGHKGHFWDVFPVTEFFIYICHLAVALTMRSKGKADVTLYFATETARGHKSTEIFIQKIELWLKGHLQSVLYLSDMFVLGWKELDVHTDFVGVKMLKVLIEISNLTLKTHFLFLLRQIAGQGLNMNENQQNFLKLPQKT